MTTLMNFLNPNTLTYNVLVIILFALFIGWLFYRGEKTRAKRIILAVVLAAERKFDIQGAGKQKYAYAIGIIYSRLPWVLKIFISENELQKLIEEAVMNMKNILKATDSGTPV